MVSAISPLEEAGCWYPWGMLWDWSVSRGAVCPCGWSEAISSVRVRGRGIDCGGSRIHHPVLSSGFYVGGFGFRGATLGTCLWNIADKGFSQLIWPLRMRGLKVMKYESRPPAPFLDRGALGGGWI